MTAADWPIIRYIAVVLGFIMNIIYEFTSFFGIHNIALCIILFVVFAKLLLLPTTYRKEKSNILKEKLVPNIKKVSEKYENKLDNPMTKIKFNIDKGFVLYKYNLLNSKGCLTALIQIPIFFALFAIIKDVPRFVPDLQALSEAELNNAYLLFGISLKGTTGLKLTPAIIFPALTAVLQVFETMQSMPKGVTMQKGTIITNLVMIGFTFYFSATFPIFCSIYWIARSVMNLIIVAIIKATVKNKPLEFYENRYLNKLNKSRIKRGLPVLSSC